MIRLLLSAVIALVSSAVGILVADAVLDDMSVSVSGFVAAVAIFTLAQVVLTPFIAKVAARSAPAFLGGIGLVSTLVALILAHLFTDGLDISGLGTWALATVIVWFATAIASLLLPLVLLRNRTDDGGGRRRAA